MALLLAGLATAALAGRAPATLSNAGAASASNGPSNTLSSPPASPARVGAPCWTLTLLAGTLQHAQEAASGCFDHPLALMDALFQHAQQQWSRPGDDYPKNWRDGFRVEARGQGFDCQVRPFPVVEGSRFLCGYTSTVHEQYWVGQSQFADGGHVVITQVHAIDPFTTTRPLPPVLRPRPADAPAGDSPIRSADRAVVVHATDFLDEGVHPLSLVRHYDSARAHTLSISNALGAGWQHNYQLGLRFEAPGVWLSTGTGEQAVFAEQADGRFVAANGAGSFTRVEDASGAQWLWQRSIDGASWYYRGARIDRIVERNGWVMRFGYDAYGRLARVTNHFGRSLQFAHDPRSRLVAVRTPDGQLLRYTQGEAGQLERVRFPDGEVENLSYGDARSAGLLLRVKPSADAPAQVYAYDARGRAVRAEVPGEPSRPLKVRAVGGGAVAQTQVDAAPALLRVYSGMPGAWGAAPAVREEGAGHLVPMAAPWRLAPALPLARPAAGEWRYDERGLPVSLREPGGRTWRFGHDETGNRVRVQDPAGRATRYTYDGAGRVLTAADASGGLVRWVRDARGRVQQLEFSGTQASGQRI